MNKAEIIAQLERQHAQHVAALELFEHHKQTLRDMMAETERVLREFDETRQIIARVREAVMEMDDSEAADWWKRGERPEG